ncbi:hypothetical protein M422DRAFT_252023 [Sphaerobolus stellatus SS14]|uniref:Uncharacterized protein n=1 Tax=Sphaerobolus stellatus (strain SS14) TaxID=990650 RepID=A0A0C9VZD0_SPHS4|nr:hypothetical protein M422DRAFT_252023 [Sphaerobolus stellatus SS14]
MSHALNYLSPLWKARKVQVIESNIPWYRFIPEAPRILDLVSLPSINPETMLASDGLRYRITSAPHAGLGTFTTRNIALADLIMTERPILVAKLFTTNVEDLHGDSEQALESKLTTSPTIEARYKHSLQPMHPKDKAAFLNLRPDPDLKNIFPLSAIFKRNAWGLVIDGVNHGVIGKLASHYNHRSSYPFTRSIHSRYS